MEHYDDDDDDDDVSIIAIENTDDIDGFINLSTSCTPEHILPSTVPRSSTALYALQTAYSDLKKRYNDIAVKNQYLSRTLRDVEKINNSKMSYNNLNYPMSYSAQGAAAMGESTSSTEIAAQEGYVRCLQRELNIAKAKIVRLESVKKSYEEGIKVMDDKYKIAVEEDSKKVSEIVILQERLDELQTENQNLNEKFETCKMQMEEAMLKIGQGQGQMCNQDNKLNLKLKELEQECARLRMNEEIARSSMLEKDKDIECLQRSVAELETEIKSSQSQMESLSLASIPANEELMHLKKIIRGLKETVLQQNDFLTKFVKTSNLVELKNGTADLQGRRNPERIVVRHQDAIDSVHLGGSKKMMSPHHHIVEKSLAHSGIAEDSSLLKVSLPPQTSDRSPQQGWASQRIQAPPSRHISKSEIFKKPVKTQAQPDLCKSEVFANKTGNNNIYQINVHAQPEESWLDVNNLVSAYENTGLHQNQDVLIHPSNVASNLPRRSDVSQRQNASGYDLPQRENGSGYDLPQRENGSGYDLPQRQNGSGYDLPQRQNSSGYDLPQRQNGSSYDLRQRENSSGYDLPQRENSSGYDFLRGRVSEQEDMSPMESSSEERVADVTPERTNSSHVCPVCSVDFPQYTMDEFQTHVFECFDDSNGPETLHAEPVLVNDKICPMCNALFPGSIPQQEFETHVQTHFEDGSATGFEILEP